MTYHGTFEYEDGKSAGWAQFSLFEKAYFAQITPATGPEYDEIDGFSVYFSCSDYLLFHLKFFGMTSIADLSTKTKIPEQLGKYAKSVLESYSDAAIPFENNQVCGMASRLPPS